MYKIIKPYFKNKLIITLKPYERQLEYVLENELKDK